MGVVLFTVLIALGGGGAWASVDAAEMRQRAHRPDNTIVEIIGAKTPEQLPEYLVWTTGLRALAAIKKQNIVPALEELGLSSSDGELVFAEGRAQVDRDKECLARQDRVMTMLKAAEAKAERIAAQTKAIVIECRWATLDAKDRMLAALSPEGQVAVVGWVLDQRRQISVTVAREDLEFFRQPR